MALWNWTWDQNPWGELHAAEHHLQHHLGWDRQAFPALNVYESGEAYGVEAEVPGVAPEDLELTVEGNVLTISGTRKPDDGKGVYHRRELAAGRFSRTVSFPVSLDSGHVEAQCVDGVLTARIAKAPEARARKIAVKPA